MTDNGTEGTVSEPKQITNANGNGGHQNARSRKSKKAQASQTTNQTPTTPTHPVSNEIKSTSNRSAREWSAQESAAAVSALGAAFNKYEAVILDNGITGPVLLSLTDQDLVELGVSISVHRKSILNLSSSLQSKSTPVPKPVSNEVIGGSDDSPVLPKKNPDEEEFLHDVDAFLKTVDGTPGKKAPPGFLEDERVVSTPSHTTDFSKRTSVSDVVEQFNRGEPVPSEVGAVDNSMINKKSGATSKTNATTKTDSLVSSTPNGTGDPSIPAGKKGEKQKVSAREDAKKPADPIPVATLSLPTDSALASPSADPASTNQKKPRRNRKGQNETLPPSGTTEAITTEASHSSNSNSHTDATTTGNNSDASKPNQNKQKQKQPQTQKETAKAPSDQADPSSSAAQAEQKQKQTRKENNKQSEKQSKDQKQPTQQPATVVQPVAELHSDETQPKQRNNRKNKAQRQSSEAPAGSADPQPPKGNRRTKSAERKNAESKQEPSNPIPAQRTAEVTRRYTFGSNIKPMVLGRGGRILRSLQDQTNCRITLDEGNCSIRGLEENVEKAFQLLGQLVDDYKELAVTLPEHVAAAVVGVPSRENIRRIEEVTETTIISQKVLSELRVTGPSRGVDLAVQILQSECEMLEKNCISIEVPQAHVGFILGKKAVKLEPIRRLPGVISVVVIPSRNGNPSVSELIVSGTNEGMEAARQSIQDLADEASRSIGTRIILEVPKENVGLIIGKGGAQIRDISTKSSARINVETASNESQICKVTIEGSASAVAKARELIDSALARPSRVSERMDIPADLAGRLIGKAGANVRNIQTQTGAIVQVNNKDVESHSVVMIEVSGLSDAVAAAKDLIEQQIRDFMVQEQQPPQARGRREGGGPKRGPEETILVPRMYIGQLIGRGGSRLREIEQEAGCRVNVSRDETNTSESVEVRVVASTADGVKAGVRKIMAVVALLQQDEDPYSSL